MMKVITSYQKSKESTQGGSNLKRVKVGDVHVDAGMITIHDPCYAEDIDFDTLFDLIYKNRTPGKPPELKMASMIKHKAGHEGAGVVMNAGYGDGTYPVYITLNDEGRVAKAEIIFIEEE